jgi:hypothetical protein
MLSKIHSASERYIFVASDSEDIDGNRISAYLIAKKRLNAECWPLYAKTPLRNSLKKGDCCLIYLAGNRENAQHFIATVSIKEIIEFSNKYIAIDGENVIAGLPVCIVLLETIKLIKQPISIKKLLNKLSFICANKQKWGAAMHTGCRRITKDDYNHIIESE